MNVALFRNPAPQSVRRLYVVVGAPCEEYEEPHYDTDPRPYGLQVLDEPVSEERWQREYRQKIRAFPNRDDAISCGRHCSVDTVMCPVYDRVGDEWVYNQEETSQIADQIR